MVTFDVGRIYNRSSDIHERFAGQEQGGISTPARHSVIFIFTGESGKTYGYRDEYQPDGTFWYTGEGQVGDMKMVRGNKAIRDHAANNKTIHVFEVHSDGVCYQGTATYIGHHHREAPDVNGDMRMAIVFEFDVNPQPSLEPTVGPPASDAPGRHWRRPMSELRDLAMATSPSTATPTQRRSVARQRSEAVRVYVLRRADGVCEGCGRPAPFRTKKGRPYLEPHHIFRLADGGPDNPAHVAAVCPNCHGRAHHAGDADSFNQKLLATVQALEAR